MPCYDKKLEASRSDFYNEAYATRDVDCVITTGELDLLMREKGWDLSIPVAGEDDHDTSSRSQHQNAEKDEDLVATGIETGKHADVSSGPSEHTNSKAEAQQTSSSSTADLTVPPIPELITHPGTSSGSYLHSLISLLSSTSPHPLDLTVRSVRASADYEEYTLTEQGSGKVVFRGAKCYGFRNLQNVVRKVGREAGVQVGRGAAGRMAGGVRGRVKKLGAGTGAEASSGSGGYDYVEVMACPGGCVNGGGQLRPPPPAAKSNASSGALNVDAEGFKRDWESSGVSVPNSSALNTNTNTDGDEETSTSPMQNAKWGDREWTRKVEEVYWHGLTGLPTPPPSPRLDSGNRQAEDAKAAKADRLASVLLRETCRPSDIDDVADWTSAMDEEAETRRRTLFRTQYRAVESEVIGLAVKW